MTKKVLVTYLFLLISLLTIGCKSNLDKKWHEVNVKSNQTNLVFAEMLKNYSKAANEMVEKKHLLQADSLRRDWENFLSIHTQDGRLVSKDADGKIIPLSVVDLQKAMDLKDTKQNAIAESEKSWMRIQGPFMNAIDKFIAATNRTGATEAEIMEAKESAQQFFDSMMSAMGGMAVGAGLVAVAP